MARCVQVCLCVQSWALFVWCTTIAIATAITPGLRESVPETIGLTRWSDIFWCIFHCTLYICLHFLRDFHRFHVITTVLHQWTSCRVFDVGVCHVVPAEETSAVGALQTSISLKSRRVLLTCPSWQNMWENSLPSDVLQVKSAQAVTWTPVQSVCFSVGPISCCLNVTGFPTETSARTTIPIKHIQGEGWLSHRKC